MDKTTKRTARAPQRSRRRESPGELRARARKIVARLERAYPDARCALNHSNALALLVATILSAQCTDARVNMVTPHLFAQYKSAAAYAAANPRVFEQEIQSTGFFRNKTKSILGMAQALVERHGGMVPRTMEELTRLPGVGRKTANVVLGAAYGVPSGIVVDTHMARVARRLGLTRNTDPVKIERDLMALVPRAEWVFFSIVTILHGRYVCQARLPRCSACPLGPHCPSRHLEATILARRKTVGRDRKAHVGRRGRTAAPGARTRS